MYILHLYRCKIIITQCYNEVNSFVLILVHFDGVDEKKKKKIGNKIRSIREKRKITQEELSAKLQVRGCDITRSALAKIEVGQRHIYPDEIRHFKEILNVEYDDLFNV